jgi:dihydrofolate reductase
MPRLIFDITTSLDGYVAGPNPGPDQPLGEGGERLHQWIFGLASWQESHGQSGGVKNQDDEILQEWVNGTGAHLMGRGMFGGGDGPWGSDPWQGWWGDDPPFHDPVFVLTHHAREPLVLGDTTFTFVTDGIESGLEQARDAAGDKEIALAGGANVIQQYLAAGLVDELQIHVTPVLLGDGVRLFEGHGTEQVELEPPRVIASPGVTHLRYRVVK